MFFSKRFNRKTFTSVSVLLLAAVVLLSACANKKNAETNGKKNGFKNNTSDIHFVPSPLWIK